MNRTPSELIGLTAGSYEAYCLDEAVWFFGTHLSNALEKAGQKRAKGAGKTESARKRVLAKYLDDRKKPQSKQYADPALLFQ